MTLFVETNVCAPIRQQIIIYAAFYLVYIHSISYQLYCIKNSERLEIVGVYRYIDSASYFKKFQS